MKYLAPELDIIHLVDNDIMIASVQDEGNMEEIDWNAFQ